MRTGANRIFAARRFLCFGSILGGSVAGGSVTGGSILGDALRVAANSCIGWVAGCNAEARRASAVFGRSAVVTT